MQQNQEWNPYSAPKADVDQGLNFGGDDYVLAERGTRLAAALIDGMLTLASLIPGFVLLFSAVDGMSGNPLRALSSATGDQLFLAVGAMILLFLAFQGYQWFLITTSGQSLAKKWLGIKIVRTDGSPCGFVNGVLLRSWVLSIVSNLLPDRMGGLVYFVDALFIFGAERRCLHDHIAGTRVIVAPGS